jgi:hypothetical protein
MMPLGVIPVLAFNGRAMLTASSLAGQEREMILAHFLNRIEVKNFLLKSLKTKLPKC